MHATETPTNTHKHLHVAALSEVVQSREVVGLDGIHQSAHIAVPVPPAIHELHVTAGGVRQVSTSEEVTTMTT